MCVPHKPLLWVGLCIHRAILKAYQRFAPTRLRANRDTEMKQCWSILELAQSDERDLGNVPVYNIDTAETPERLCLRRKDHNLTASTMPVFINSKPTTHGNPQWRQEFGDLSVWRA